MRRFILSVLLLGAIIGAGHLLSHITAQDTVMDVVPYKHAPADPTVSYDPTPSAASPDSLTVSLTQYLQN